MTLPVWSGRLSLSVGLGSIVLLASLAGDLAAGMVESQEAPASIDCRRDRAAKLERLDALCRLEAVERHLRRLGLDPDEARERIACLSDADMNALSERLDQLLPGGQETYQDKPLYQRIGFWFLWAAVIALIIITFAAIGSNVT
ncbi:MAG: PA2779 family protein [Planctomycetes bacterium]|nr:PA2779 family protein [Planctomycetota bacterium]